MAASTTMPVSSSIMRICLDNRPRDLSARLAVPSVAGRPQGGSRHDLLLPPSARLLRHVHLFKCHKQFRKNLASVNDKGLPGDIGRQNSVADVVLAPSRRIGIELSILGSDATPRSTNPSVAIFPGMTALIG